MVSPGWPTLKKKDEREVYEKVLQINVNFITTSLLKNSKSRRKPVAFQTEFVIGSANNR